MQRNNIAILALALAIICIAAYSSSMEFAPYDAGAARRNLSNVPAGAVTAAMIESGYNLLTDAEKTQALVGSSGVDFAAKDLTAATLDIGAGSYTVDADGNATFSGNVTIKGGLSILGNLNVAGSFTVGGEDILGDIQAALNEIASGT